MTSEDKVENYHTLGYIGQSSSTKHYLPVNGPKGPLLGYKGTEQWTYYINGMDVADRLAELNTTELAIK